MTHVLGARETFLNAEDVLAMEFIEDVADIVAIPEYQKLKKYQHHLAQTRYQHCLNVAWYTFLICKHFGFDAKSAARGAMLHDFFLYDYRTERPKEGLHAFVHPKIALENAEKYLSLNTIEQDVILHHMFPVTRATPKTPEGWVITFTDKYSAILEFVFGRYEWARHLVIRTLNEKNKK